MYVYIRTEPALWTVGHYAPNGKWIAESDHDSADDSAERAAWLNGETDYRSAVALKLVSELRSTIATKDARITELEAQLAAALATVERSIDVDNHGKLYSEGCNP